jgi:hypothetical protein
MRLVQRTVGSGDCLPEGHLDPLLVCWGRRIIKDADSLWNQFLPQWKSACLQSCTNESPGGPNVSECNAGQLLAVCPLVFGLSPESDWGVRGILDSPTSQCPRIPKSTLMTTSLGLQNVLDEDGKPRGGWLQLLRNVSGAFRPGVLTALIGVTGAGKTTLLDVLAGRKTGKPLLVVARWGMNGRGLDRFSFSSESCPAELHGRGPFPYRPFSKVRPS